MADEEQIINYQDKVELRPELTKFIESIGLLYETYGVPRIGGRILGLMLVTHGPVSAEWIAATLKVSRSSVSTNMRVLVMTGLAEQVAVPGDRRDYYQFAPKGWEQTITARILATQTVKALAEQGLAALAADDPARIHLEEMAELQDMMKHSYERMLAEWRARHDT